MGKTPKGTIDLTGAVQHRITPPFDVIMGRITRDLYEGVRGDINQGTHPGR